MRLLRLPCCLLLLALLCGAALPARAGSVPTVSSRPLQERIHDRSGRPLVLVYWASWCGPCRHYKEKLAALLAQYPDRPFDMLAVALDTDAQRVETFLAQHPLPYPAVLADPALVAALAGTPVPTTVLYQSDGSEARRFPGDVVQERLNHFVRRLLEQDAAPRP